MLEKSLQVLQNYVQSVGLKTTKQREIIAREFFAIDSHLNAEEILEQVRKIDEKVSLATVYRTLKILQACGLARSHHFGNGQARFEPSISNEKDHDHLICTGCDAIVEFFSQNIETIKTQVSQTHKFEVTHHRMELYGKCKQCKDGFVQ